MREADYFRQQAQQCRRQAGQAETHVDRRALRQLAQHYEKEALKSDAGPVKPMH
jgi:hypothetical protein